MGGKFGADEVVGEMSGWIKTFNKEKGYGFIASPDLNKMQGSEKDVFLHQKELNNFEVGDTVLFTACFNSRGQTQAKNLRAYRDSGEPPEEKNTECSNRE